MIRVQEALTAAAGRLEAAGVDGSGQEAAWLLAHALGCSAGALRLRAGEPLAPAAAEAFAHLVERRVAREPIQYILGTEEFMGMTLRVTPAVLIPRFDTEVVVRETAARLQGSVRIADVGTGSGAIALGLAALLPVATVVATDISPEALAVAQQNAAAQGLAGRIAFRQGDLLAPLAGEKFDAIVSNPPYIAEGEVPGLMPEVRGWEPMGALTPGADGLLCYRRLAADGPALLRSGGYLAVEVGIGQADQVQRLFDEAGLRTTKHLDTVGIERVVIGRKP